MQQYSRYIGARYGKVIDHTVYSAEETEEVHDISKGLLFTVCAVKRCAVTRANLQTIGFFARL